MKRRELIQGAVERAGLRFPVLFVLLLLVTLLDFVFPDFVPFVDEIVLALLTVLFGLWRDRRKPMPSGGDPGKTRG